MARMNDSASQPPSSPSDPDSQSSPASSTALPDSTLSTSVRCIGCSHDLIGLPKTGVCPGCGTPIENSIRATLLIYSRPEYIRKLYKGVFLIEASFVASFAWIIPYLLSAMLVGTSVIAAGVLMILVRLVDLAITIASIYGGWIFSSPDPDYSGRIAGENARRHFRIALVIIIVPDFILILLPLLTSLNHNQNASLSNSFERYVLIASYVILIGASLYQFIAALLYIKWLGVRLLSRRVVSSAARLVWLGPLLSTVGILLLGLGPIIAIVLYLRLLDLVRKEFKRIEVDQARVAVAA